MKKFFAALIITILCVCVVNAETDFFLHIGSYIPALKEHFPVAEKYISEYSEKLSDITDKIPSPAQIVAMINHEELPIDPTDVASNAYIKDSPMLSFYPQENISINVDGNNIRFFGITHSKYKQHLISRITDSNGNVLDQSSAATDADDQFSRTVSIPETDETQLQFSVYTGSKQYGDFESWVLDYIYIVKNSDGTWALKPSPVYENNKQLYEKDKSIKDALKSTPSLPTDNETIRSIATEQTKNCQTDYERVAALHDWLCDYLFYDSDSIAAGVSLPYSAPEVIISRKAVCLGFATTLASLCRTIGIPCNVVSGYALGIDSNKIWTDATANTIEQNHAWNEAYVDGRWIIIDPTWDCTNKLKGGEYVRGSEVSHIYFDANIEFFSTNHKILEYLKRW